MLNYVKITLRPPHQVGFSFHEVGIYMNYQSNSNLQIRGSLEVSQLILNQANQ